MSRVTTTLRQRSASWSGAAAAELLGLDLPALDGERRQAAGAFVVGRVAGMPTPMAVGVGVVSAAVHGLGAVIGRRRVIAALARRPLPVFADYLRLLRSLGYAYIWERWPETAADGRAA